MEIMTCVLVMDAYPSQKLHFLGVFMQKQYLNLCIMKNHVHRGHIVQLELKNHSSTTMLQLHLPKCNSYATTLYEYVI